MINKMHIVTLYSIIIAIAPFVFWVDSRFAHAEDVELTNARIMIEIQQIGLDSKAMVNEIKMKRYSDKMVEGIELKSYQQKEFDMLHSQKVMLIEQQHKLDSLCRVIK